VTRLQHPSFGQVAFVAVGATLVGSVELLKEVGSTFAKGDCYGYFQYGGSTCVIVTEPGAVGWDPDLLDASARGIELLGLHLAGFRWHIAGEAYTPRKNPQEV
ncbi:unnamed protein product, partial [Durusdinium trenchii]